ncbi:hypothetical protein BCR32DRAFT_292326 [Anaeromyces robustus]|uniref:RGS domain-containing protein n=1 Tax=Anaeromyces robustus TaxID=1754192 RepID=A0A1Y1XBY1_9FUNG|nr:hypothetical protein BCR32DRAFT_292326 [Anaeromyces robustus]|eukprot:ORX82936.1 hypothetical protein BCR32DRAFT_292326 [Anaeromyces robustus]
MDEDVNFNLFPNDWDIDSLTQYSYYKKCLPYASKSEDFDYFIEKSIVFKIYGLGSIGYMLIISYLLLKHRKHYIFKRQGRVYFIMFMIGSLLSVINSFLIQIKYKIYPCVILNFLVSLAYPLSFFSYAMIILTNFKNYYNSQVAYSEMFRDMTNTNNNTKKQIYIFKFIYKNMPHSKIAPIFIFYLIVKWLIVYMLYFLNSLVSQIGYCRLGLIHIPEIGEVLVFLFIFLPLALIEILKFDDTFRMKKKIVKSILTTFLCVLGYMTMSVVKPLNCSFLVKYIPSDSFAILLFLLSTVYLCVPTIKDIIHINKQKAETKATVNGMLKMLQDNILLREFSEFCRKENCTENILFYQHYWKYRKLFDNQERNSRIVKTNNFTTSNFLVTSVYDYDDRDRVSQMSFETPLEASICVDDTFSVNNTNMINGMESSRYFNTGRKITKNEIFVKEAKNIIDNFILNEAKFEVNISDKVKKNIISNFKDIKNNSELQQQDFKERLKCLFDESYNEVVNSLFLNSYTNYILLKRNEK